MFHRGFKTQKTDKSTRPHVECFDCVRVLGNPDEARARVFEIGSRSRLGNKLKWKY